jgi:hypothetical protein
VRYARILFVRMECFQVQCPDSLPTMERVLDVVGRVQASSSLHAWKNTLFTTGPIFSGTSLDAFLYRISIVIYVFLRGRNPNFHLKQKNDNK